MKLINYILLLGLASQPLMQAEDNFLSTIAKWTMPALKFLTFTGAVCIAYDLAKHNQELEQKLNKQNKKIKALKNSIGNGTITNLKGDDNVAYEVCAEQNHITVYPDRLYIAPGLTQNEMAQLNTNAVETIQQDLGWLEPRIHAVEQTLIQLISSGKSVTNVQSLQQPAQSVDLSNVYQKMQSLEGSITLGKYGLASIQSALNKLEKKVENNEKIHFTECIRTNFLLFDLKKALSNTNSNVTLLKSGFNFFNQLHSNRFNNLQENVSRAQEEQLKLNNQLTHITNSMVPTLKKELELTYVTNVKQTHANALTTIVLDQLASTRKEFDVKNKELLSIKNRLEILENQQKKNVKK
jgi:hypothetical protein